MKRLEFMTYDQWSQCMDLRKSIAERRMSDQDDSNGFFTLNEVKKAANILYGKTDIASCHSAELWLTGDIKTP